MDIKFEPYIKKVVGRDDVDDYQSLKPKGKDA